MPNSTELFSDSINLHFNKTSSMKKTLIALATISFLLACGGGETKKESEGTPATEEKKESLSDNPDYKNGLALVAKSDCLTCHKVSEASTGPAYKDVAARYANAADTTIERIANHIIKGGSGQWGAIPMTPHPAVTVDDAKAMVKYVLLLNNQ
jgi:cytochrome c